MVTASAERFLAADGALASIHQVAEKLPTGGHLKVLDALGLCHPAHKRIADDYFSLTMSTSPFCRHYGVGIEQLAIRSFSTYLIEV